MAAITKEAQGLKHKGKFLGCDPSDPAKRVYSDRLSAGEWERVVVTKLADGTFTARFKASAEVLSGTPTGWEGRPEGTAGAWEVAFGGGFPKGPDVLYYPTAGAAVEVVW